MQPKKLLIICGPTSTGKTSLALRMAKLFNGEIISADSRQVFKMMDIGTGKDLPKNAEITYEEDNDFGYYEIEGVKVWGYDLADPTENFSVSSYITFAQKVIKKILFTKRLPILVGGTGLYIKGVVDGIPTASIPLSKTLRKSFENKSVEELFEKLSQIDPIRAASLNSSDNKNPRRLIRAIEVAMWNMDNKKESKEDRGEPFSTLFVGLSLPKEELSKKIKIRVEDRIAKGVKKEVKDLLKQGVTWNDQSMTSMGYGIWKDYFDGRKTQDETIDLWIREEVQYTKRQIVWFKKEKRINWFDILDSKYLKSVELLVQKWYKAK